MHRFCHICLSWNGSCYKRLQCVVKVVRLVSPFNGELSFVMAAVLTQRPIEKGISLVKGGGLSCRTKSNRIDYKISQSLFMSRSVVLQYFQILHSARISNYRLTKRNHCIVASCFLMFSFSLYYGDIKALKC